MHVCLNIVSTIQSADNAGSSLDGPVPRQEDPNTAHTELYMVRFVVRALQRQNNSYSVPCREESPGYIVISSSDDTCAPEISLNTAQESAPC